MDNRLLSTALLGTGRQPYQPAANDDGLGDVLKGLAGEKAEEALLGAAASYFLYERAGTNPPTAPEPLPEVCPADTLRPCNLRSVKHLNTLLDSKLQDILQEWLEAVAYYGKHAPAEKLPALLDLAESQSQLAPVIEPVLGERGRWLAVQNPEWTLYAGLEVEQAREIWETGTKKQRVAYLKKLRMVDPDRARDLLQETWSGEGAEQRTAFLNTFEFGLNPSDEPFLEERLEDRSKDVRAVASELLARLPGSALVGRMIERANRMVSYDPKRKSLFNFGAKAKTPLVITPFEAVDAAMQRDGIEQKSPYNSMGDKAYILNQVIAAVPPIYWLNYGQNDPETLLREAADSEWAEALIRGWRTALTRNPNDLWAEAFIRIWQGRGEIVKTKSYFQPTYSGLTYPQFEELVLDALRKDSNPIHDSHRAIELVFNFKGGEWRPVLIQALIKSLRRRITADNANTYHWRVRRDLLKELARHTPTFMLEELSQGWPEDYPTWDSWEKEVRQYLSLIELRREMLKEISQ